MLELTGDCEAGAAPWGYPCGGAYTRPWGAVYATTTYSYSSLDLLTGVTDAQSNTTAITYDSLGRKKNIDDPDMGFWAYQYHPNGTLQQQTDAKGQVTTFTYDTLDRLTARSGTGWADNYAYDEPFGQGKGHRTSMSSSLSGQQQSYQSWNYDVRGRVSSTTVNITGHTQRSFSYSYNSADLLTSRTYPSGEAIAYTYDGAWRQTSVCGTVCYASAATYTALDQPDLWTLGNALRQDWNYDVRARLSEIKLGPSATPTSLFYRTYAYDGASNVTRVDEPTQAKPQVFRYDDQNRLISASAIDTSGTITSIRAKGQYGGGAWPIMRLRVNGTQVGEWIVSSNQWTNYPVPGAVSVNAKDTVDVEFVNDHYVSPADDRNLFVDTVSIGTQTVKADNRALSYDIVTYDDRERYASDGALWFTGAMRLTERYQYDTIGNLKDKADLLMTYGANGTANNDTNGPHQARNVGGYTYGYDSNGNLTNDGARNYTWDASNRPSSINVGALTESYRYNADGARVRTSSSQETRLYLEDVWEETTAGATRSTYMLNNQPVAVREVQGSTNPVTYLHGDQLGSVSIATTSAGAVASRQEFDPWGKVRPYVIPRTPITQTKRNYTGQILDSSGLLFYNARYYDPGIGRFISADTIVPGANDLTVWPSDAFAFAVWNTGYDGPANPQSLNRYSYVDNNPLSGTDPTGHFLVELNLKIDYYAPRFYNAAGSVAQVAAPAVVGTAALGGAAVAGEAAGNAYAASTDDASDPANPDAIPGLAGTPIPRAEGVTGYAPDIPLPRGEGGEPEASSDYPHTQLGVRASKRTGEKYRQTRTWKANRVVEKDTDWTDHGRPRDHANPHDHPYTPNKTGGTPKRDKVRPPNNNH